MRNDIPKEMARAEYYARIHRVIDHVERNLSEDLSVERLAEVGCFSSFHFHRVFGGVVGEPLMSFVTRLRLEKAATLLVNNPGMSVSEVAVAVGIADSTVFARAFRRRFGVSASGWRAHKGKPGQESKESKTDRKHGQDSGPVSLHLQGADPTRRFPMANTNEVQITVEIRELPPTPIAYVRNIGPYAGDPALFGRLFGKLFAWAGPRGLLLPEAKTVTIYHDNPDVTPPEKQRISVGISVPAGTPVEGEIGAMDIPAGKYAVATCAIRSEQFGAAWEALMGGWFPSSGWQPDDRPCFECYLNDPEKDPEGLHRLELWEPVRPL